MRVNLVLLVVYVLIVTRVHLVLVVAYVPIVMRVNIAMPVVHVLIVQRESILHKRRKSVPRVIFSNIKKNPVKQYVIAVIKASIPQLAHLFATPVVRGNI
jgi:hypothetical protein